jgi:hypothetical protein
MILRMAPLTTALTELLAVETDGSSIHVAVVARDAERAVVRAAATGPATGDLAADLQAALAAFGARARPRRAILITPRATAVVLQVPPTRSLSDERVAGLVRYELEPYLPHDEVRTPGAGDQVACGWAEQGGDGERPGPLLAAGLTVSARDEMRAAFREAGLTLVGVYPQLGCAAALLPPTARDVIVMELAQGRVAAARVSGDRVSRLVLQRASGDLDELATACRALVDDGAALALAGPVPPYLEADLADLAPARVGVGVAIDGEDVPPTSASLLGAAHHALGLPGGARVAGVPGQPARVPLLRRPLVQGLIAAALPVLLAVAALLVFSARRDAAAAAVGQLTGEVDLRQRGAEARKQLERERDALNVELKALRATAAEHEEAEGRRPWLLALLRAVADATPQDLVVEGIHEEAPGTVRLTGFARAQVDVQAFVRDLAAKPALAGLPPGAVTMRRDVGRFGASGYHFDVRFGVAPTTTPAPAGGRD